MYRQGSGVYEQHKQRGRRKALYIALAVFLVACGAGAILKFHSRASSRDLPVAIHPQSVQAAAPVYTSAEGRYLFNGTIFWGRAIERDARRAGDLGRSLANLSTFDRQAYDAWIGDLECPVANLTVPYERQVQLLNFNCPPDFAPYFTKYFDIIGLANNHTGDQGHDAFLETQKNLTNAGAQVYGSYDPSDATNRCEIISMPVRVLKNDNTKIQSALPAAFCAYHYVGRQPLPGELEYITQYARIMPTFAFAHMGIEYTPKATVYQEAVGHGMIDAGAEFVVMNHPHWVQNTEAYKGKLIMYSTGNFIFDQLTSEELRSASLDVTLSTPYDNNLAAWTKLAADCKASTLHDSCLAAAQAAKLTKPAVTYKFGLVAGDELTQRWIPQKANPTIQKAVEERTNWAQTIAGIH